MHEWSLVYEGYEPEQEGLRETLCTLGNGYFATRGAAPDCRADERHYPGVYLAGGYNRLKSKIAGREIENEDLVNMPNWLPLSFRIDDGAWFSMDAVEILAFRQELDLKQGVLHRRLRFRDPAGRTSTWEERRFVSMADPHFAGLAVRIGSEDWSGRLTVRSALDGGVLNEGVERYRALASRHLETLEVDQCGEDTLFLLARTNQSRVHVAEAARTRLYRDGQEIDVQRTVEKSATEIALCLSCAVERGDRVDVEKVASLYSSHDAAISEPGVAAKTLIGEAGTFDELAKAHAEAWRRLWEESNIELVDKQNGETSGKLRMHIFHMLQTVSPHTIDVDTSVPARGWHGEAYRGHIFWDELFIFPFLNLRNPTLTRALLRYRLRRLPQARRAARAAGFAGAMFPWQSGSDGREECQKLHLNPRSGRWLPDNTHRQRHINSAIAYNIWKYYQVSDDHEYLHSFGAELLIEIARFWTSMADYNPAIDRYEIKDVMGPDEYHTAYPGADPLSECGVDNNAYTNIMAAWVLGRALDVIGLLPETLCRNLCERIGFDLAETDLWEDVRRKLRVPFHGDGIISQFEGYGALREFDWAGYQEKYGDIQRLDRILEAEGDTVNRYKASKQADVLMLFYLFSTEELSVLFEQLGYPFEPSMIPKNIDYYAARTSHGSSLSRVVDSWVLARSDRPRSWRLFQRALDSDLADIQGGTTREGVHCGAMSGTIDLIQRCYLGVETRSDVLFFNPELPDDLDRIKVKLRYRRHFLDVEADHERLRITSQPLTVSPITIAYRAHFRDVTPGKTYEFRLLRPEDRDRDENRRKPSVPRPASTETEK